MSDTEASSDPPKSSKVVNDPIHGHIELHPLCVAIMDTPQFQRLRDIKQLGGVSYVYPGGSHNRFEHSLGVCHLAGRMVRELKERQPKLEITDKDVLCVEIAGLCHDLGHGPFSHLFDMSFIPRILEEKKKCDPPPPKKKKKSEECPKKWEHEDASCSMIDFMLERRSLKEAFKENDLKKEDIEFIKGLIEGKMKPEHKREEEKAFLYEIVANKRNGVDVDKWDYFLRDCHHVGIKSSFYVDRFIRFARVIKVDGEFQICWRDKIAFNLYEMFHTRFTLHRQVYQHETVKAIELMLVDVLVLANNLIKIPGKDGKEYSISECIQDMAAYTKLTDGIFTFIRLSKNDEMKKAQSILEKIDTRVLYPLIAETSPSVLENIEEKRRSLKEKLESELREGQRISVQVVSFGFKDDPVANVRFYSKMDPFTAVPIEGSKVSKVTVPTAFREQVIRVYLIPSGDETPDRLDELEKKLIKDFSDWRKANALSESKTGQVPRRSPQVKSTQQASTSDSTPSKVDADAAAQQTKAADKAKKQILRIHDSRFQERGDHD